MSKHLRKIFRTKNISTSLILSLYFLFPTHSFSAAPSTTPGATQSPQFHTDIYSINSIIQEIQKDREKQKPSRVVSLRERYSHKRKSTLKTTGFTPVDQRPFFDIPVTYNQRVKKWIKYFQGPARSWYKSRLERSHKYLPLMKSALREKNLPQDLAYLSMIESGFSPHATSSAQAVGYWQFISSTAHRYGLKTEWWLDERRDFVKSTQAAASYLGDLYKIFGSWYLTAAAYNMGEGKMQRLIQKHHTKNFWILSQKSDFPEETRNYIPKLLAALLIAKAPKLYGFREIKPMSPYSYDYFHAPGGTDLDTLSKYLNLNKARLKSLNPELIEGFVPEFIKSHRIRIPRGMFTQVSKYMRQLDQRQL